MLALQHQFIQQQQQQLTFINVQMQQMQQMQANFMITASSLSCAWPVLHATEEVHQRCTKSRIRD